MFVASRWPSLSPYILIAVNIIPLVGALFYGWTLFDILLVFWLENVVIGVLNVIKMLTRLVLRQDWGVIGTIPFFTFHYGMFTLVHGVFVVAFFSPDYLINQTGVTRDAGFKPDEFMAFLILQPEILWMALGLFASHFYSYIANFLIRGEIDDHDARHLMFLPYVRVVVLHIIVLFGGFIAVGLGQPLWVLIVIVVTKIGLDLQAHLREHAKDDAKILE